MAAQGKYIAAHEAPYYEAVDLYNEAVWSLDPEKLERAVTDQTLELCVELAARRSVLAGGDLKADALDYLEAQQEAGVVLQVTSVDAAAQAASVALLAGTQNVGAMSVGFVEQGGRLRMDLTVPLASRIAELEEAIGAKLEHDAQKNLVEDQMRALMGDLAEAIDGSDVELFLSIVSDDTAQLALLLSAIAAEEDPTLPEGIAGYITYAQRTVADLEIVVADTDALSADVLVHPPIGPGSAGVPPPADVRRVEFVREGGRLLVDMGLHLTEEIEALAELTGHVGPLEPVGPKPGVGPSAAVVEHTGDGQAELACEAGSQQGCLEWALSLAGQGGAKEARKARKILERLCSSKGGAPALPKACMHAALMQRAGEGGPVDEAAARASAVGACIPPESLDGWRSQLDQLSPASEKGCMLLADMLLAGEGGAGDMATAEKLYERVCLCGHDAGCVAAAGLQLDRLRVMQPWGIGETQEFDLAAAQLEMSCPGAPLRCFDLGNEILAQMDEGLWYGDAREAVLALAADVLLNPQ
jgi:hypothetical protein